MRPWATALALALAATTGSAFVPRAPVPTGRTSATSSHSKSEDVQTRQPQGDRSSAVAPLEGIFGGYFQDYVTDTVGDFFAGLKTIETTLPQDPKADAEARKKKLADRQEDYMWTRERIPEGLPFLETKYEGFPPPDELPTVTWITNFAAVFSKILLGATRGTVGVGEIAEALTNKQKGDAFGQRITDLIKESTPNERPVDLDDYLDLHAFPIQTPESSWDYEDDDTFARLRLQGHNCVVLKKASQATRDKLKILDSDSAYKGMKEKVDNLLKEGKLFVVDHEYLKGLESDSVPDGLQRYLIPSIALFEMIDDDLLPIKPIGIQLGQGESTIPIFTPEDGLNWLIAKTCFEACDFTIHEVVSHLGNTHCVLEGPMTAMNRQLPEEHPIHALFHPHTEGTAFINWGAQSKLIAEGGGVDTCFANKIADAYPLVVATTVERISKDFTPMQDLAERGMTKEDFPGRYPYRDHGLQYYDAIFDWVSDYLDIYYTSDKDIDEDYELMAFVNELVVEGEMKVAEKIRSGADKRGELKKFLASLIYTASTLHAAVNFPQKPITSYVPQTPAAVYQPPPTDKKPKTFQDYLDYLPPMELAKTQVVLTTLLGSIVHTKLGDYDADQFTDERVRAPLMKFQQALEDIEEDMVDENAHVVSEWRLRGKDKKDAANFAYKTILPDVVPQSINI